MRIETFFVGPMDNMSYLIYCPITYKAAMVDPAWDITPMVSFMTQHDLDLDMIFLTHGHGDHLNRLPEALAYKNVPVYMSSYEHPDYVPTFTPLNRTEDNDKLPIGASVITCIHTPGHSPGSQCFYLPGHLITGDTVFIDGVGHCRFAGADVDQFYHTLHVKLWQLLPDETVLHPGHNYGPTPVDTWGNQKLSNPYLLLNDMDEFKEKRLD